MQHRAQARTSLPVTSSDTFGSGGELPFPPSKRTEGRTLGIFAATGTHLIPIWVSCWSGSQYHLSRKQSFSLTICVLPVSNCVPKAPPDPASYCSQLTLWTPTPVKPRLSYARVRSCQVPTIMATTDARSLWAPPHLPLPTSSCLASHLADFSFLTLLYFLLYTYDLVFTPTI